MRYGLRSNKAGISGRNSQCLDAEGDAGEWLDLDRERAMEATASDHSEAAEAAWAEGDLGRAVSADALPAAGKRLMSGVSRATNRSVPTAGGPW